MQVGSGAFDIEMLVLSGAAFGGKHSAPMDIFKVAVRKFIVPLGIRGLLVVNSQIPFAIFLKTTESKELIFLPCGGLMLTPCIPFVEDKSSFADELFGMVIGAARLSVTAIAALLSIGKRNPSAHFWC